MYEFFLRNELPDLLEDILLLVRESNVLPTWEGSLTLHLACETVFTQIFPQQLVKLWWTTCMANKVTPLNYHLQNHIKALVYKTRVTSRAALYTCICAVAEHIHNHPQTLHQLDSLYRCMLKNAQQLQKDTLNNYCEAGTLVLASGIPKYAVDYVKYIFQYCLTLIWYVQN
jgi:hypothetical protein